MSPRYISTASNTRPNDTNAYTALDVVTGVLTFNTIGPVSGMVVLTSASLRIDVASVPSGMSNMRLHLYSSAPTDIADNAAFDLPSGDRAKYLGYIDIGTPIDLGATLWAQNDDVRKVVVLEGTSLYGRLQTIGGFTPTAQAVKTITLTAVEA